MLRKNSDGLKDALGKISPFAPKHPPHLPEHGFEVRRIAREVQDGAGDHDVE